MIIKSSTNLRNDYGKFSSLAHETCEPIYITKNGEGDLVAMSIDAFERREEMIRLKVKLEVAEQLRLSGVPTYSIEQVFGEIEDIYSGKNI